MKKIQIIRSETRRLFTVVELLEGPKARIRLSALLVNRSLWEHAYIIAYKNLLQLF